MNFTHSQNTMQTHNASTANLIMGLIGVSGPAIFASPSDVSEPSQDPSSPIEPQAPQNSCSRLDNSCNPRKRCSEFDSTVENPSQKRLRASSQPPRISYSNSSRSFLDISDDEDNTTNEGQEPPFYSHNEFKSAIGHRMELVYAADEEDLLDRDRSSTISESPSSENLPDDAIFHDMSSALYDTLELMIRNADILRQGGESIIKNANTMKAHAVNIRAQLEIELRCEMKSEHQNQTACSCGANTPGSVLNVWKSQFQGGFMPNGMDFSGLSQTLGAVGGSSGLSRSGNDRFITHGDRAITYS
ncbi:hypothetical protein TWF225_010134 [Orbilia oligospora]|uniref:Uncharacterized protein n=1 Tax=Orbilia oligospora TaxID=2813651 RepID=A0A8H2E7C5_ORBOL|nr:hypothetical protein TWF225_010134 [Orbilia oligospora]KAF3241360.1 hypothetical protein TWF128_011073 [Orbilia oligospora]KAF3244316.1 hypothetical protein TWF217_010817 [Orbilia oligospora]KAF3296318.1 hypothetical protein TWF132_010916 [Orbilia oligospora]TGJ73091.1 hypothetical protein EYR41_000210 [Orbilia oligospora]